jgi:hypothetical protein
MTLPNIEAQLNDIDIACPEAMRSPDNASVDAISRAAYWVSLLDAPPSTNTSGQTIYLPVSQPLSPAGLHDLFRRVAHQERLRYEH